MKAEAASARKRQQAANVRIDGNRGNESPHDLRRGEFLELTGSSSIKLNKQLKLPLSWLVLMWLQPRGDLSTAHVARPGAARLGHTGKRPRLRGNRQCTLVQNVGRLKGRGRIEAHCSPYLDFEVSTRVGCGI